jgi:thiol-disulfide isomerase/thioredoxin
MRTSNCVVLIVAQISLILAQHLLAQSPQENYLRGWITPDSLYRAAPEFQYVPDEYQPAEEALWPLRQYDEPLTILTFFGNWCSDSKRELPRLFALLNLANNQNFSVKLFGLDRSKKDDAGFAETFNVTHVPTFIFLREEPEISSNGQDLREQSLAELGRIIETPTISLEQDWVDILRNNFEWRAKLELQRQLFLWLLSIPLLVGSF